LVHNRAALLGKIPQFPMGSNPGGPQSRSGDCDCKRSVSCREL